jgi:hypothetical protein
MWKLWKLSAGCCHSARGAPGLAGAGDIIRDTDERWIKGFTLKLGISWSIHAEL